MATTLPLVPYALYFGCSEEGGGCYPNVFDLAATLSRRFTTSEGLLSLWDPQAALVWLGWMVYLYVCWAILPGDWIEGLEIRDGTRKQYKINGMYGVWSQSELKLSADDVPHLALQTLLLTLGLVGGTIYQFGPESFTFLHDHILGFATTTAVGAYIIAVALYISSLYGDKLAALGGNSGYFIHDVRLCLLSSSWVTVRVEPFHF